VGEDTEIIIVVKNESLLPFPYVLVTNEALSQLKLGYKGSAIFLAPDESKFIKTEVLFKNRGIYDLGKTNLIFRDFFNVFSICKFINEDITIKVYPKIYTINEELIRGGSVFQNIRNQKSSYEDIYTISDVRKYRNGDNIKHINWKVSAKHGELYVKNFDSISGEDYYVFLNLCKDDYKFDITGEVEESCVDFCISMINYLQMKDSASKLFINSLNEKRLLIKGKRDVEDLLEYLLIEKCEGIKDYNEFIWTEVNDIPKSSYLGIIVEKLDEKIIKTIMKLKNNNRRILIFYYENCLELNNVNALISAGLECMGIKEMINRN
jgi:hypothetical protein